MNDLLASFLQIEERVDAAKRRSGRQSQAVKIVAVSKKQPVEKMIDLQHGLATKNVAAAFGESYVQEAKRKFTQLSGPFESHLIGPLQRNKVRDAVRLFDLIQSVHSAEILEMINSEAQHLGKTQAILLQVNISRDPAKSGFLAPDLPDLCDGFGDRFPHVLMQGLMTITRLYETAEGAREDFRSMRELACFLENGPWKGRRLELSMGMSDDFEVAVEEGATLVRIGTALFGPRSV